jgi:hypothetical protein
MAPQGGDWSVERDAYLNICELPVTQWLWQRWDSMRRVSRLLDQQPLWRLYVVVVAIGLGVGAATGHGVELSIGNTLFVVIVFAIGDAIRRFSNRRRRFR